MLEPSVISHIASCSACETGEQWQRARALLSEPRRGHADVQRHERCSASCGECIQEPIVISYSAEISACGTVEQWQRVQALSSELRRGHSGAQRQ